MATLVKPNLATLIRRESSSLAPADLPAAALEFVNQLSELDVDVDYVTLRFDALTKELGLTYSDALKQQLGLANHHYTLVQPQQSTEDHTTMGVAASAFSFYFDIYSTNLNPPSLSLANAYVLVLSTLLANTGDYVVIWVADSDLLKFYNKVSTASANYPLFLNTAKQLSLTLGLAQLGEQPQLAIIKNSERLNALADWASRHDQVYSAVLVLRYPEGQLPEKYQS